MEVGFPGSVTPARRDIYIVAIAQTQPASSRDTAVTTTHPFLPLERR